MKHADANRHMARRMIWAASGLSLALALSACGDGSPPPQSNFGKDPKITAPTAGIIPTINIPSPAPWPKGEMPKAPAGFTVQRFADGLDHPRWLYLLPNGDVLVAESSTEPPKSDAPFMKKVENFFMNRAGAVRPSPDKVILLRDTDGDGKAETRSVLLDGQVHQPYGMALIGDHLYVGGTAGVWRFAFTPGMTKITGAGEKITTLPTGKYNNHWARNIIPSKDGTKLFVAVGSSSNIADHGIAEEKDRANILEMNLDGSGKRVFASGIRNPNGMAFEPQTGTLWTVVNERDMLGDDLVPDYLTRVRDGDFYGWPWSYWGKHVDDRVKPQNPDMVAKAIAPDYALGAHTAALGLTFYTGTALPAHYQGGAFIGLHGSWNRSYLTGYKVVYVPFANGMPTGVPEDFLTGFIPDPKGNKVYGRPVGVIADKTGAILVADDNGDVIWRVSANTPPVPPVPPATDETPAQ
ncbi:MAG TPA: sorbosone dehydrogenase family protein [Rhizomicrobium sp.]|nr:sorbosone dehydrogenase family protein [Rhizomicrobium sp.]